ncbi:HNH endonuclease [Bacillus tianshenii]|nr:HNH endonuclease [Bacillus tianshenii]
MGKKKRIGTCALCARTEVETTVHHLTPKERGGTFEETANLCIPCHRQIHALFTNEELAVSLNSIEALRNNEQIAKFIKWIRKQPPTKLVKMKKSNHKKKKAH